MLNELPTIVAIVTIIIGSIVLLVWASSGGYDNANTSHCKQYEIYPEKHLDKVPPACQPQWFEVNQSESAAPERSDPQPNKEISND